MIVACEPGGAVAAAGLRPGDVVTAWRRGDGGGAITSPFQLALVEQQQAALGAVTLTAVRGSRTVTAQVRCGGWLTQARPVMDAATATRWLEDRAVAESGDVEPVLALAEAAGGAAVRRGDRLTAAWWHLEAAVGEARRDDHEAGRRELEAGADLLDDDLLRAVFWEQGGERLEQASRPPLAIEAFRSSLALFAAGQPAPAAEAFARVQLGHLEPHSSEEGLQHAVAVYRGLGGERFETAWALNVLGAAQFHRGDPAAAEASFEEAHDIVRRVAPDSALAGQVCGNLGLVSLKQEDYAAARGWLQAALELNSRLAPTGLNVGYTANFLGLLAKRTGRFEEARAWYQRALEAFELQRPDGVEVAGTLTNLGNVAVSQLDLVAARRFQERALELRERLRPDSSDVAGSLNNLGSAVRRMGDLTAAEGYLERALAIKQRLAPGTLWTANTVFELGEVARAQRRFAAAAERHQTAFEIRRRVLPDGCDMAYSLTALGLLAYDQGRRDEAERLLRRAVELIERQTTAEWLSADDRSRLGGRFFDIYRALAAVLVDQGRPAEAFELVDRARARQLRAMVQRRLEPPAGVPRELWLAAAEVGRGTERLQARLAGLDPVAEPAAVAAVREELTELAGRRERLWQDIALLAPGASVDQPSSPGLAEIRAALDPGTLLLSYVVGDDRVVLFAVGAGADGGPDLSALTLPLTRAELVRRIGFLRGLIDRGRSTATVEPALRSQARQLYQVLLGPVAERVAAAGRLLIVADGPLLDLPFGVLTPPGAGALPLGRTMPLAFDPSAGVFVELRHRRRDRRGAGEVLACGGARYPAESPMVSRLGLASLAGARREVQGLAGVYGDRATVLVGEAASEARFKRLAGRSQVLHLALHTVLDRELPLESALLFSRPGEAGEGGEDGVLRAWEVIDQLRLDADVVVLSSCTSGAGSPVDGEGRVGLARAFQLAGARSVLMSQWEVDDQATADLMLSMHRHLATGSDLAEALRLAQDELARGGRPHPFEWAAFQLSGDWR